MLYYTRLERPAKNKHSSLLGPLVSYEGKKVLWVQSLELYSRHFIFFRTYKKAQ
jgi:hypothetical protein